MLSGIPIASPADAIFAPLGAPIGFDLNEVRMGLHLACGVLLELIAVAACAVYHAKARTVPVAAALALVDGGKPASVHAPMVAPASPWAGTAVYGTDAPVLADCATAEMVGEAFVECYAAVKDGVLHGAIKPTLSAVRSSARISQEPARRILEALNVEGVTRAVGRRRYVRVDAAA